MHLEANNRTWDTVAEQGDELGVFTDPRPPYGCLGLRLTRQLESGRSGNVEEVKKYST